MGDSLVGDSPVLENRYGSNQRTIKVVMIDIIEKNQQCAWKKIITS